MNKHLSGFVIFSLIVGSAVFVSALTTGPQSIEITERVVVTKKKKKKKKRRHCRPRDRSGSSLLNAEFDRSEGVLTASFENRRWRRHHGNDLYQLHFYSKDGHGTRFLKTERVETYGNAATLNQKMEWLGRLDPDQNVYVIPTSGVWSFESQPPPPFDASKATAVTLAE